MDRVLYILENKKYTPKDVNYLKNKIKELNCPHGIRVATNHVELVVFCKDSEKIRNKITSILGLRIIDLYIGEPEVKQGKELEYFMDYINKELFWLAHTFMEIPWRKYNDVTIQLVVLYMGALAKAQENDVNAALNLFKMIKVLGKESNLLNYDCVLEEINKILNGERTNAYRCINISELKKRLRYT
ncbi:MAG: hypothetical protein ACP5I6_01400 [Caldisphaera sp.]|jgi:hypothetical protein|nr:MAG: hypothetical protein C0171_02855 [Caldisphaera sp.]